LSETTRVNGCTRIATGAKGFDVPAARAATREGDASDPEDHEKHPPRHAVDTVTVMTTAILIARV
jgi:hypothetical protein